jgi:large subunit ribosomal protein L5
MSTPRLKKDYDERVVPAIMERFQLKNRHQAPKLTKIVVNMGVGDAIQNAKLMDAAMNDLTAITGQRPSVRRAKKSISNFKLRENLAIGCAVTLRGNRMWEFFDRLVSVAIPRIRDFRGLPQRSFDGQGNYSFGIEEQIIFPEINYDKVEKVRGMDVTFVTTAPDDEQGMELLKLMRFPFRER